MASLIFILVSFFASVIGCICGIGGGVIIKPVLDAFGLYSVSTISFMSGCIVLSMTTYSVLKAQLAHESVIEKGVSTYLGIGAALGGLAGKQLFDIVKSSFDNADTVGAVQAAALFAVTLGTALYTLFKRRIPTHHVKNPVGCAAIGLCLGVLSSFLGIGGGPINLVVLYFFFSMETKPAAQNSLYIILLSQIASLLFTIITGKVPQFPVVLFICMVCCGILGGVVGRRINKRIDSNMVNKLFLGLLVVIMGVCCYNFFRFI
ncbi:MAG: sulfite exporter TauE/SafE family protein [Oscillospiraceae bacterium]|nr:sulfite exporter TauE/SafE family protein [Oscillospiraceae bacterium]